VNYSRKIITNFKDMPTNIQKLLMSTKVIKILNRKNQRSAFKKLVGSILKRNKKDKFKKLPCI
jgi:preprotein translocase subunit Sec63